MGVDPKIQDSRGWTAFHLAAYSGTTAIFQLLMEHKGRECLGLPNAEGDGDTALQTAVRSVNKRNTAAFFRALGMWQRNRGDTVVYRGGPVLWIDCPNARGRTALHTACMRGDARLVEAILEAGSQAAALEDDDGCLPRHYVTGKSKAILSLLERAHPTVAPAPGLDPSPGPDPGPGSSPGPARGPHPGPGPNADLCRVPGTAANPNLSPGPGTASDPGSGHDAGLHADLTSGSRPTESPPSLVDDEPPWKRQKLESGTSQAAGLSLSAVVALVQRAADQVRESQKWAPVCELLWGGGRCDSGGPGNRTLDNVIGMGAPEFQQLRDLGNEAWSTWQELQELQRLLGDAAPAEGADTQARVAQRDGLRVQCLDHYQRLGNGEVEAGLRHVADAARRAHETVRDWLEDEDSGAGAGAGAETEFTEVGWEGPDADWLPALDADIRDGVCARLTSRCLEDALACTAAMFQDLAGLCCGDAGRGPMGTSLVSVLVDLEQALADHRRRRCGLLVVCKRIVRHLWQCHMEARSLLLLVELARQRAGEMEAWRGGKAKDGEFCRRIEELRVLQSAKERLEEEVAWGAQELKRRVRERCAAEDSNRLHDELKRLRGRLAANVQQTFTASAELMAATRTHFPEVRMEDVYGDCGDDLLARLFTEGLYDPARTFDMYENRVLRHMGSRCVVFEAEFAGRKCALKEFRLVDDDAMRRFLREVLQTYELRHHCICPMEAVFRDDRNGYVQMPLYPHDLGQWVAAAGPAVAASRRLEMCRGVAQLLLCLHCAGYVHGDVTCGNVLVNAQEEPCLTDFEFSQKSGARTQVQNMQKRAIVLWSLYPTAVPSVEVVAAMDSLCTGPARHTCLQVMHLQGQHMWHTATQSTTKECLYWSLPCAKRYAALMRTNHRCTYMQGRGEEVTMPVPLPWVHWRLYGVQEPRGQPKGCGTCVCAVCREGDGQRISE